LPKDNYKKLFLFAAIIFFIFGIITSPWEGHQKWVWRGLFLYFIPLFCMFFRSKKTQTIGIIIGLTLGLQTLVSPVFFDYFQPQDLFTTTPNTSLTINIPPGIYPGLDGAQENWTDSKGYRVTKTINYETKPSGHFRIFTIGASTTEGFPGLGNQSNWPHLLQEKLNRNLPELEVEVINAGMGATMSNHHLATLKKVLSYSPDMVVFLVGINDWNRHIKVVQDNVGKFIQFDSEGKQILLKGVDPKYNFAFTRFRKAFRFDHTFLAELIKAIKNRSKSNEKEENTPTDGGFQDGSYLSNQMGALNRTDKRVFRPRTVYPFYADSLQTIGSICKSNKIDCLFATQPTAYQPGADKKIKDRFWMVPPNRDYTLDFDSLIHIAELYNNFLINFAKENKFPSCDLASQIKPSIDNFLDDCHFNLLGAKKVANLMSNCIIDSD
jgi:lysophospholipase L1-like esterase